MKKTFAQGMVLVTIILMDILAGTEVDLFVPSFPELQTQFSLSPFWVEMLLSINFIGFCLSLFFTGSLADRYGRKPIIVLGLTIFVIGSLLCLWAASYKSLLIGRFLQGIGVAAPSILSFLIIADSYPLEKQQYLMALLNGLMNASIGAAPVVGSHITLYFHWQGNFMGLLFLGLTTLTMTIFFIPTYKLPEHQKHTLWGGYVPMLRSKPLMLLIMALVLIYVPYWIFVGMSPILYMEHLGVSLSHFGYYQGALALMFAIGSIFFGMIMSRYKQKKLLYITNYIFIISLISIYTVIISKSTNPLLITLAFLPFIIGQIIPTTLLHPLCLNFMPQAKGRVAATIQGSRLILTAIWLQVAGYCYQGSFRNIGIIMSLLIFIAIITLFYVIKNRKLMEFSQK